MQRRKEEAEKIRDLSWRLGPLASWRCLPPVRPSARYPISSRCRADRDALAVHPIRAAIGAHAPTFLRTDWGSGTGLDEGMCYRFGEGEEGGERDCYPFW